MDDMQERIVNHLRWLKERERLGTRTWKLADRHSCKVPYMRRQLVKLEKMGLVKRNERYSAVNDIFWEAVQ